SKAKQTNDDTGGAQGQAEALLKKPYSESGVSAADPATSKTPTAATPTATPAGDRPVLKRPNPNQ
ncbi:MAG: hypothetical protein WCE61_05230, partial [Candidatus Acidiferrum sp.]